MAKRKSKGDVILATEWNSLTYGVSELQEAFAQGTGMGGLLGESAIPIKVLNKTGSTLSTRQIAGIKQQAYRSSPIQDQRRVLELESPTSASHTGKWVVMAEQVPDGCIGRAFIAGTCLCKVNITDAKHAYADAKDSDTTQLESRAVGSAQMLWKEDGTGTKYAIIRIQGTKLPPTYKATANQDGTTVAAQRVKQDGTLSGTSETIKVYADAYKTRINDYLLLTEDSAGQAIAIPAKGNATTPFSLPAGTADTAEATTWDINSQPDGYMGVQVEKWFRLYWTGTEGDPVYQFVRTPKYDSKGALVYVGPEVRSVAFTTGTCQQ